jgi:hypothetical protein
VHPSITARRRPRAGGVVPVLIVCTSRRRAIERASDREKLVEDDISSCPRVRQYSETAVPRRDLAALGGF